jgi:capsular exopolysaccharide synthesis family protein
MSRIHQILAKAERDGTARRTAAGGDAAVADNMPELPPLVTREGGHPFEARPLPRPEVVPARPDRAERVETDQEIDEEADIVESDEASLPVDGRPALDVVLSPLLVAALDPLSPAAEQYRSLRSRISQTESGQAIRVLQITSPGKNDGKTITSLNLALTMAQEFQRRVLVIDADLRQPRLHDCLGLPEGPGLVDVLTGTATLEDALVEIPEHHLTVLRAGRSYERPAEMLGSAPMRRLIDTFRTQFDRIVIDSSPALVSDPVAVASLADRVLLVVRAGQTTKPAIARAIGLLGPAKLLGLVFNESAGPQQAPPYRPGA